MKSNGDIVAAIQSIPLELERVRSQFEASLAHFHNGVRLDAARYLPADGRTLAHAGQGRLVGWSVQAVGGSVTLVLRDGRDETADALAVVSLSTGESQTQWFGPGGISVTEALFLDRTGAGTLVGSVLLGAVD
jgi:hypothetical protein